MRKDDSVKSGSNRRTCLEVLGSAVRGGVKRHCGRQGYLGGSRFLHKKSGLNRQVCKSPGFLSRQAGMSMCSRCLCYGLSVRRRVMAKRNLRVKQGCGQAGFSLDFAVLFDGVAENEQHF